MYHSLILTFKSTFCKQTVQNLMHHILGRLIWFCTVSCCPVKWTLGFYGLTINCIKNVVLYLNGPEFTYFFDKNIEYMYLVHLGLI